MSSIFGSIFGKSDYKKKIKEAGFEKLIEFHDIHNEDKMEGGKYRFSDRHIIRQNYIQNNLGNISQTLDKLKKLKEDLSLEEYKDKEKIEEAIDYLIFISENRKKNEIYLQDIGLFGIQIDDRDARFVINDGNLYFFDNETYEMFEEETITKDKISHIEVFSQEEDAPTYNPKYMKSPNAPSSALANLTWDNEWMQKNVQNEYQRKLAEYQANLVNVQLNNQNEERKYQESLGKKVSVKYVEICFNDSTIERLIFKYSDGYMYIKRNLPTFDIVNLDTGETEQGMEIPKEVEKITIGDDSLCYITLSKNLYINHQIKDNILEVNVANGNNIVITKYESADFKQMAKDLKARSIVKEGNDKAFKSIDCKDGAARFFAMVGNPESKDNYVVYILMEYKNIVYEIKRRYIESQDKLIDYDEEIDGKLSFEEKYFDSSEASISIINNMKR